ncbi:YpoC family protein [Bacillus sp. B-jedd]|uniref:YpoC family protein n=1 Tax=Bacillus sp. B-jedd TaxID=1476857 RepID=UPI0005156721|nr:hypothetical protein [Bacillus sp. B-jedd]CEG27621.1 YpoC [Bacillus sp. B-jedd]
MDERADRQCIVPVALDHPFFKELILQNLSINSGHPTEEVYFIHEMEYYHNKTVHGPWLDAGKSIPRLLKDWQDIKVELNSLYKLRRKEEIRRSMKKGISLFLQFLFWSNGVPVILQNLPKVGELAIKPANCEERIAFLIERPDGFHSFIQLGELIDEQKKRFFANSVKNKN